MGDNWFSCSRSVTTDFTTHGRSHIYGLPCPSTESLDPMDPFCTFDVSNIIPKNTHYLLYMTFNPFLAIYTDITLKPVYIGMCAKGQIFLEFSLMWIRITFFWPSICVEIAPI